MKIFTFYILIFFVISFMFCGVSFSDVSFDFEHGKEGWTIPDWALFQEDCVGSMLETSADMSSSYEKALKLTCDFPGDVWTAAVVEYVTCRILI